MDYLIRLENEKDYQEVDNLIRESFWNVYRPGCVEHFIMHKLRDDDSFIKELSFVMEKDGKIIGQNVFVRAYIETIDKKIPVLTMGPISIDPSFKRKGYGAKLLEYTINEAKNKGYGAIFIEGNIDFYSKVGFTYASKYNIKYKGLEDGTDSSFFLCLELSDGFLNEIEGMYETPDCYFYHIINPKEFEEYEKSFPKKKKLKLEGSLTVYKKL